MRKYLFILFSLVIVRLSLAQELASVNKGVFEFSYANDVTGMTDKYYTNGVGFSLTLPTFLHSPFNPGWLKRSNYTMAYHTVNLQYDVFTPDLHANLYTDRPFAATAILGSRHQYVYRPKSIRLTSELKMGIIGQAIGAGRLQNGLHEIMPGADPVDGWETQIRNDVMINYIIGLEKAYSFAEHLEFIAGSSLFLGLPYTKLETSALLRIGLFNPYFDYLNQVNPRKWQAYASAGISGSFVAYNATLQGGILNQNNPYVLDQVNHLVASFNLGVGISYKNANVIFSQTVITPEFQGAVLHSWGELRLIFVF